MLAGIFVRFNACVIANSQIILMIWLIFYLGFTSKYLKFFI